MSTTETTDRVDWREITEPITIRLPGLTAIRIDPGTGIIAVDNTSGTLAPEYSFEGWAVADLRDGTYGDFHRLKHRSECPDADCTDSGQHEHERGHLPARVTTDWCIAWGGEDANDCAGRLEYDDEAEAREMTQWIDGGIVARQTVIRLPWVNVPDGAADAPCCTGCGPDCGCGAPHGGQS